MPTKIRLQRHGKKKASFFHIVIADSRAPRDGKFIEKIGTYNPNLNPAVVNLKFERALDWIRLGAQPTDTTRAILSYEGVLYKNHLNIGVKKGAMKQEEAEKKFEAWKAEKLAKIQAKVDNVTKSADELSKKKLAAETEKKNKRAAEILAKSAAEMAAAAPAEAATEVKTEEVAPEVAVKEEAAPVVEAKKEEAPVAETSTEEAPAAETSKEEEKKDQ
jgi:small subunit ribosomal protein S16